MTITTNYAAKVRDAAESAGFTIDGLPDEINREQALLLAEELLHGLDESALRLVSVNEVAAIAEEVNTDPVSLFGAFLKVGRCSEDSAEAQA